MSTDLRTDWNLIELADFGVLRVRGPDIVRFLQGQVSNDVERLTPERSQLAGYHNPQGRTIALLRLVQLAPDDVLAILPRELTSPVASRLGKFILRAKVKIADESASWRVTGLVAPDRHGAAKHGAGARGFGGDALPSTGAQVGAAATSAGTAPRLGNAALDANTSAPTQTRSIEAAPARTSDATETASSEAAPGRTATETGLRGVENADIAAALDALDTNWAAGQFEQASAVAAAAGEMSSAAAQLEEAESVVALPTASALMLPDEVDSQSGTGTTVIVRVGAAAARWLVISPAGEAMPLSGCVRAERDVWRLLDIADGLPQVYGATSEEFVAQMLNLDALGAIAFDKGCYTGQEVIARAHYRGRVKRRMQRFMSCEPARLAVGDSGQLADGRTFKVVEAAQLANGRCEFLAVAPIVSEATVSEATRAGEAIDAETLPLPYPPPE
jgi:folate-binding protein YgfZ